MTKFKSKKLKSGFGLTRLISVFSLLITSFISPITNAVVIGEEVSGPVTLTASAGYISVADGGSIYSWGYSTGGTMQLPGPTLIVNEGDEVSITLVNSLPTAAGNVSIVFPGHKMSSISGGVAGDLTKEAPIGGSVTYTFTANNPGTYQYHSGTRPDLQVEMGLYGALIVRPTSSANCAYNNTNTCYDRENLFLLSEIDLQIHQAAELQASGAGPIELPQGAYVSEYWLINGRAAPDTMASSGTEILPTQPYNAMARMHPGEKLLMRVIGAGRESHPFHFHGNHAQVLARDGRLLLSATDSSQLAGPLLFTIPAAPGSTTDAIFEWTGKDLGWDIYGHQDSGATTCTPDADGYHNVASDPNYKEWCADHNKPIPVTLPALSSLAFGGFYSGSPFLGALGALPPGEGGLNPDAGFSYMWHSHTEREMVNNDVFPGGMMTMLIIEAPNVVITD